MESSGTPRIHFRSHPLTNPSITMRSFTWVGACSAFICFRESQIHISCALQQHSRKLFTSRHGAERSRAFHKKQWSFLWPLSISGDDAPQSAQFKTNGFSDDPKLELNKCQQRLFQMKFSIQVLLGDLPETLVRDS